MHPHEDLLTTFYTAFQRLDGEAMAACYHPDARFSDPVFPSLKGEEIGAMWCMLCERAEDFSLEFSDIQVDDEVGRARWEARYMFSATGREVHNRIHALFRFEDGKIIEHTDSFPFWKWTRQALGVLGVLLGWTPIVQNKVRRTAAAGLDAYIAKRADKNAGDSDQ